LVYRSVAFLLFALFMSSKLCRRWLFLIVAAVLILTALTIIIVLLASSRHADFRDIDLVLTVLTSPTGLLWLGLFFFVCCVILWYFW
jgi:bacteriorhodopsin